MIGTFTEKERPDRNKSLEEKKYLLDFMTDTIDVKW